MTHNFEITPYEEAGPLKFGASRQEVEAILGTPDTSRRTDYPPRMNLRPVLEAWYDSLQINLAYDIEGRLLYICFGQSHIPFQGTVTFQGLSFFSDGEVLAQLMQHDPEPFEWVGFVFFMKLGIRLEGFHAPSESGLIVSLFERGRYDSKLPQFTPYRMME